MSILVLGILAALWPAAVGAQAPPGREAGAAGAGRPVPETLNFANGLLHERRYEMAAEEYERFLKGAKPGPDADEARFGLANARLFQGAATRARKQFEEFLQAAPKHPNAATAGYRLGETAYLLSDLRVARQALEKFTAENPGHRQLEMAWPYLGDICLRLDDLPLRQTGLRPGAGDVSPGPARGSGTVRTGPDPGTAGRSGGAAKVLQTLVANGSPEWTDRAWLQIGQILANSGQPAPAVEAFETLERVAPKSLLIPEARLDRAKALLQLGRCRRVRAVAPLWPRKVRHLWRHRPLSSSAVRNSHGARRPKPWPPWTRR